MSDLFVKMFKLTIVSIVSPDLDTIKFEYFSFLLFIMLTSKSLMNKKFFLTLFLKKLYIASVPSMEPPIPIIRKFFEE